MPPVIPSQFKTAAKRAVKNSQPFDWSCLLTDEKLHDVFFLVGDVGFEGSGETIGGVKAVLALNSSVFKEMLFGGDEKEGEVLVPDVDPRAFKLLLQFLHTGRVELTDEVVMLTLFAALKFQLPLLEHHCIAFVIKSVSLSNACDLLMAAENIDCTVLVNFLRSFIHSRAEEFFSFDKIQFLSYSELLFFVKSNNFLGNLTEKKIFDCCMKWAEHNCEEKSMEATMESKISVLSQVLKEIEFCRMDYPELATDILASKVLSEKEMLTVYTEKAKNNFKARTIANHRLQRVSQQPPPKLKRLANILLQPELCDVTFVANESKEEIPSCRAVLAARCEYFEAMFYNNHSAEFQAGCKPVVEKFSATAFKSLLRLFYGEEIQQQQLGQRDMVHLIEMMSYYDIDDILKSKIVLAIDSKFELSCGSDINNVCSLLSTALKIDAKWLLLMCEKYIDDKSPEIYESKEFGDLSTEALEHLLNSEDFLFRLTELQIFQMCLEWSKQRCSQLKLDPNPTNCRDLLSELLCLIRFPLIGAKEVSTTVHQTMIITDEEMLQLTLYFCSEGVHEVPYSKTPRTSPTIAGSERWQLSMSSKHSSSVAVNTFESLQDGGTSTGAVTDSQPNSYIAATFPTRALVSSIKLGTFTSTFWHAHANNSVLQYLDTSNNNWKDIVQVNCFQIRGQSKEFQVNPPVITSSVRLYRAQQHFLAVSAFVIK